LTDFSPQSPTLRPREVRSRSAGFGKRVKESAAREGRSPSTGATIQIAASKKLGFMPAKAVKDRLNG
jgi:nucleoid DNA-binding protein